MKRRIIKFPILFLALCISIISVSVTDHAGAAVQLPLDYTFSGTAPQGTAPWITATFADIGSNNVRLTMSSANLTGDEFISYWYFNLNPDLAGSLTFSPFDTSTVSSVTPTYSVNAYKADGDGWFDIRFEFPTADGSTNRFNTGESVIYDISYSGTGSFDASSFNFESFTGGGNGIYESGAHIQSISGGNGGWIGNTTVVPEPVSSVLFVIGGVALAARSYIRKKK